jgi:hypothetical protein
LNGIKAFDQRISSTLVPNNNLQWAYADHFPASGGILPKGKILIAQNNDCSVTVVWADISLYEQASGVYFQMLWTFPGYPANGPPYAPNIDSSNDRAGAYQTLCMGTDGTFPPECAAGQGGITQNPSMKGELSFIHPGPGAGGATEYEQIGDWPGSPSFRNVEMFRLVPSSSLTKLPTPEVGHEVYDLTGGGLNGTFDYWQDGAAWYGAGGSSASELCLKNCGT